MWITAVYHQVSMFSLKPADATSTGGRSLLVPTPFSIKMALLDAALRIYGVDVGSVSFPLIRDLTLALSPPPQMIVNNCFMRIHKPRRNKATGSTLEREVVDEGEGESEGPFIRSVTFREYVYYNGPLGLAVQVGTQQDGQLLTTLLTQINYLGKRGSLFQLDSPPMQSDHLPVRQGFLRLDSSATDGVEGRAGFTLQILDDCASELTFARANIYAEKSAKTSITLGKERVLRHIVLPYGLTRSSRGFSLYERIS